MTLERKPRQGGHSQAAASSVRRARATSHAACIRDHTSAVLQPSRSSRTASVAERRTFPASTRLS